MITKVCSGCSESVNNLKVTVSCSNCGEVIHEAYKTFDGDVKDMRIKALYGVVFTAIAFTLGCMVGILI